jgi:KipI family sensor histidine kinase inhibitor
MLLELDGLAQVHRWHVAVQASGLAIDSIPGRSTLLVVSDRPLAELRVALEGLAPEAVDVVPRHHVLPVRYDGADLADVATATGLPEDEVVSLHAGADYTVAFLGFTRGFPYLVGLPQPLHLPRRGTPRARVPARSVAIAADQCGIYPTASPGGWHLLGTSTVDLFDPAVDPPTVWAPGDRVRFDVVS